MDVLVLERLLCAVLDRVRESRAASHLGHVTWAARGEQALMIQVSHGLRLQWDFSLGGTLTTGRIINFIDEAAYIYRVLECARLVSQLDWSRGANRMAGSREALSAVQVHLGARER